jgi:GT2 family glycosyltransferase
MISIIITTYNKYAYLKSTLTYLKNQTAIDKFEVVVIVDGSTDGTIEYLKNVNFNYPFRYKVITQGGLANARNQGILMANDEYTLFMDDDLLLVPDYIEKLSESLKEHPNHVHTGNLCKINANAVKHIFEDIDKTEQISFQFVKENIYIDPIYEPLKIVHKTSPVMDTACWWGIITGGNLCFPKSSFDNIGMFDSKFTSWGPEDVDICYRAFLKGYELKYNSHCTLYHLDHSRNQKGIANSMVKNALMLYKKYNKPKEILAYLNYFNGTISLKEFNSICSEIFNRQNVSIDDYVLNLKDYIHKSQLINWKKNELNNKI